MNLEVESSLSAPRFRMEFDREKTIFVGRISRLSVRAIEEYFSVFGRVLDISVFAKRPSRPSKSSYGFVHFRNHDSVAAVLRNRVHVIQGEQVKQLINRL